MNFEDSIALYAELALALAGFAGIVSAVAARERQFRPIERLSLEGFRMPNRSSTCLAIASVFFLYSFQGHADVGFCLTRDIGSW